MTQLSVNINKFATIRNARGGNNPDLIQITKDCEKFGAEGITIHPRPDERHITTQDVYDLKEVVTTELNIEGYPDERMIKILEDVKPDQATFVPDSPEAITSNAGWDTVSNYSFLEEVIDHVKSLGIRTSIFIEPVNIMMDGAKKIGTDRVELYTEAFAHQPGSQIQVYKESAEYAQSLGLELNAGHDLDLNNLALFKKEIPFLKEVSIGHALVCDALYYGLENTIQMYLRALDMHP